MLVFNSDMFGVGELSAINGIAGCGCAAACFSYHDADETTIKTESKWLGQTQPRGIWAHLYYGSTRRLRRQH